MPINKPAPSLYLCISATYVRQSRNTSWTRTLLPKGYVSRSRLWRHYKAVRRGESELYHAEKKPEVSFQVERGRSLLVKKKALDVREYKTRSRTRCQLIFSIIDFLARQVSWREGVILETILFFTRKMFSFL